MSFAYEEPDPFASQFGPSPVNLPLPGGRTTGTLEEWLETLRQAAGSVWDQAEKVVAKGALNIKNDARDLIKGRTHPPTHIPHYPSSITYDVERTDQMIRAEIGPDKDRKQGALGNILEFGTVNNEPIPHLYPALDNEEPRFEKAIGDLGEGLLA